MLKDYDRSFKIIIAGHQGAGKSSLLLRYVDNTYSSNLLTTIGVDFKFKTTTINQEKVKLQIWDTAGSEAFKSIVSAYYRGSDAVVLVYDNSDQVSFDELAGFWIEEVNKYKEPECEMVLLANKSDIDSGKIPEVTIKNFCETNGISFYKKTSAKTGDGVTEAFEELAGKLLKKKVKSKVNNNEMLKMSIEETQNTPPIKKKCC